MPKGLSSFYDCCKDQKIRSNARVSRVCCDAGHEALFHRQHLRQHLQCMHCHKPWKNLDGKADSPYLKSLQTRQRIESAAESLWNEFIDTSKPRSYQIPLDLGERRHVKSIVKLLEKKNFVGDKYSMGSDYLRDPDALKAFCDVLLLY